LNGGQILASVIRSWLAKYITPGLKLDEIKKKSNQQQAGWSEFLIIYIILIGRTD
jgi:hypothetical protein